MLPLKSLDRDKGINLAQADPMGRASEDQNLETQSTFPILFCPGIQLVGLLIVVQALQTPSQKSSKSPAVSHYSFTYSWSSAALLGGRMHQ
jgi:hypothetical protein